MLVSHDQTLFHTKERNRVWPSKTVDRHTCKHDCMGKIMGVLGYSQTSPLSSSLYTCTVSPFNVSCTQEVEQYVMTKNSTEELPDL